MRRSGRVLMMVVALGFLVADASSSQFRPREGYDGERKSVGGQTAPWPCCDRCGGCNKSIPPRCRCLDVVSSCHPSCKKCVKYPISGDVPPVYQCMDRIPNYCQRACSPDSLGV